MDKLSGVLLPHSATVISFPVARPLFHLGPHLGFADGFKLDFALGGARVSPPRFHGDSSARTGHFGQFAPSVARRVFRDQLRTISAIPHAPRRSALVSTARLSCRFIVRTMRRRNLPRHGGMIIAHNPPMALASMLTSSEPPDNIMNNCSAIRKGGSL